MENKLLPFIEVINNLLKDLDISQGELAKRIGVKQSTVSKWVSGMRDPKYPALQKLCYHLGLDANEILGLKEF